MEFVQHLAGDLQSAGVDVWWDLSDIQGSDVWERKIEAGLRSSQYFIIVMTPASLDSRWVRREYLSADNRSLKIIPLKLKPCDEVPLTLRDIQPIDAINRPYTDVLSEILRILQVKVQTRLVAEHQDNIHIAEPVGAMKPRNLVEKEPVAVKDQKSLTVSVPLTRNGLLDLGGIIFSIVFFILAALYAFGNTSNQTEFFLAFFAILTGLVYLIKRQISAKRGIKISIIIFLIAHTLRTYGELGGFDISSFLAILDGIAAVIVIVALIVNFQSPEKPAPFASIFFATFLFLFAAKLILNLLNFYPSEIYLLTVIAGIIASILMWLEQ